MESLMVYAGTPPAAGWGCRTPSWADLPCQQAGRPPIVEDKENVLPTGTFLGGPQLPQPASGGKKGQGLGRRRPLNDVTQQYYEASSKTLCIGTMGGCFGLPMPTQGAVSVTTCSQQAAMEAQAAAAAAASAAQARAVAAKRQALRAMR